MTRALTLLYLLPFFGVVVPSATNLATAAPAPSKLKKIVDCLYHGYNLLDKKQWERAEAYFLRASALLKKKKIPTSPQKRVFFLLGRADYHYLTGLTAEKRGKQFLSCRRYKIASRSLAQVNALSTTWKALKGLNPTLPGRMDRLVLITGQCKTVPSVLTLGTLPAGTVVQQKLVNKASGGVVWKTIALPLKSLSSVVTVRVLRAGFQTWQKTIKLEQWSRKTIVPVFKKKKVAPKPVRRPPPIAPPKPPKSTFADGRGVLWIVGGVAVVAISATVVILSLQNLEKGIVGRVQFRPYEETKSALQSSPPRSRK